MNDAGRRSATVPLPIVAVMTLAIAFAPGDAQTATTIPLAEAPTVDGDLSDPVWDRAAVFDGWVQTYPGDNTRPNGPTRMLLLHDGDALYLAVTAEDTSGIRYSVHPRDRVASQGQDWIGFYLDTFGDRRQSFAFAVNPVGIQGDNLVLEGDRDVEWDGVFESAASIMQDGLGYTVEVRLPFSSLRFSHERRQAWGLLARRTYGRTGATDVPWPIDRDLNCTLCQMRTILLDSIRSGRGLEINPAVVLGIEAQGNEETRSLDGFDRRFEPSINIEYGLGRNLVAAATLYPDFSQVESDAGQLTVNNRIALFFPERRPFFLEGADVFEASISPPGGEWLFGPSIRLVHSRTIVDPDWGAKIVGKTGGTGVGLMVAQDAAWASTPTGDSAARVEVARVTQDVTSDGYLGGVLTHRHHEGRNDVLAGIDTRLRLSQNLIFSGVAALSHTGAAEGSSGDSRAGRTMHLQLDWQSRHWEGGFAVLEIGPDFDAPLGFIPGSNAVVWAGAWSWIWQSTGLVEWIQPQVRYERILDKGARRGLLSGERLADELWAPSLAIQLSPAITVGGGYQRATTVYDGITYEAQDRFGFEVASQSLDWLRVDASLLFGEDVIFSDRAVDGSSTPSWTYNGKLTATIRPVPAMRGDVSLLISRIWRRRDANARSSLYASALLPRVRAEYQIDRRLGVRFIGQWRDNEYFRPDGALLDRDRGMSLEFLISYVVSAGTAVYLGWTDLRAAGPTSALRPARRGGIAKASYVWRF